jgi:hypothetical protein
VRSEQSAPSLIQPGGLQCQIVCEGEPVSSLLFSSREGFTAKSCERRAIRSFSSPAGRASQPSRARGEQSAPSLLQPGGRRAKSCERRAIRSFSSPAGRAQSQVVREASNPLLLFSSQLATMPGVVALCHIKSGGRDASNLLSFCVNDTRSPHKKAIIIIVSLTCCVQSL